jgi:hypothetical protein
VFLTKHGHLNLISIFFFHKIKHYPIFFVLSNIYIIIILSLSSSTIVMSGIVDPYFIVFKIYYFLNFNLIFSQISKSNKKLLIFFVCLFIFIKLITTKFINLFLSFLMILQVLYLLL